MINISNINNRRSKLIQENNIKIKDIDYELFKKKPNKYFLEKCLKGWKSLHENESMALVKTMSLVSSYMESDLNDSEKNKAITILTEEVIPSITNISESKDIFKKYDNKIWYSPIMESINSNIECNTILNNQKKLNKRIYIESRFLNCRDEDSIIDTINEVCNDIKKMQVPMMVKYNVALENTNYTINKLGLGKFITRQEIFESVTDNFLINNFESESQFYYMNRALQENSMFEDMDYFNEGEKLSKFKENGANIAKNLIKGFMAIPEKTPEGAKKVIRAFYAKSESNILEGTSNILIWIRHMVTFSTLALSIPFGALVLFTDNFIALQVKKSEITKMVDKYQRELDKTTEKIKKAKDEKKKQRLNEYKNKLQDSIDKLKEYRDSVMSEREKDEIDRKENGFDDDNDDVTFEFTNLSNEQQKQAAIIEYCSNLLDNFELLRHDSIIQDGVYNECLLTPYPTVMNDIVKLAEYGIISKKIILDSLNEAKRDINNTCVIMESSTYDDIIQDIKNRKIARAKKKVIKLSEEDNAFKKLINLTFKVIYATAVVTTGAVLAVGMIPFIVTLAIGDLFKHLPTTNIKELYRLRKTLVKRKKILESDDKDNKDYIREIDETIKMIDKALSDYEKEKKKDKDKLRKSLQEETEIILEANFASEIIQDIREKKVQLAKRKIVKIANRPDGYYMLMSLIRAFLATDVLGAIGILTGGIYGYISMVFLIGLLFNKFCEKVTLTKSKELKSLRKKLVKKKKMLEIDKEQDENKKAYIKDINEAIHLLDAELDKIEKDNKQKTKKNVFKENTYDSLASKFSDIDTINNGIYNINNIKNIHEVSSIDDMIEVNAIMENLIESEQNCILEMKLKNKAKMYANKVKAKATQAKDTEHKISSTLDNAVENFMINKKHSMENKAREGVIKGNVIPSASKVIKLALAGAITASVVSPVVTVIGALGALAIHKKTTEKERRYILDEIEVQKELVDKKLQIAENNNDIKATEELLKLQKKLTKEEQRIKYKMSDKVLVVHDN